MGSRRSGVAGSADQVVALMGRSHDCFKDGCENDAGFGFGWPGHQKDIPVAKRGILWACSEHRAEAEQRWEKATQRGIRDDQDAT